MRDRVVVSPHKLSYYISGHDHTSFSYPHFNVGHDVHAAQQGGMWLEGLQEGQRERRPCNWPSARRRAEVRIPRPVRLRCRKAEVPTNSEPPSLRLVESFGDLED